MSRRASTGRILSSLLCQAALTVASFATSLASPWPTVARPHAFAAAPPLTAHAHARIAAEPQSTRALADIQQYIATAWTDLTRSMSSCESLADAKTSEPPVLYLPAELSGEATPAAVTELQKHCAVTLEHLTARITRPGELDPATLRVNGLLYLPNRYVVPGGQFNEMYGWDSYFIIRGLLADHPDQAAAAAHLDLAKGMVENFFFEIEHYGGVLNANRTYYLTRSQPPFLTSMILAVYQAEVAHAAYNAKQKAAHNLEPVPRPQSVPPPQSAARSAQPRSYPSGQRSGQAPQASGQQRSPSLAAGSPSPSNRAWLASAYTYAVRDYEQWTTPPHLAGDTGLARYFDRGTGPVPEIMGDPSHYYRGVAEYFLLHGGAASPYLASVNPSPASTPPVSPVTGPLFSVRLCDSAPAPFGAANAATGAPPATAVPVQPPPANPGSANAPSANAPSANPPLANPAPSNATSVNPSPAYPDAASAGQNCAPAQDVALTAEFYKGDRSMRESGFDVSFRFGPFGADTHHYAAVGLNSLLYKTERDLQTMATILGRRQDARRWGAAARMRRQRIQKYLWDARRGMFFDYDFTTRTRSSYEYATTFYPLWSGLASKQQAQAVARNLTVFEQPGGLATSRRESQAQWDYPYGWAPLQLLAVEGLRHYGYASDADRISRKFLTTVLRNFQMDRTIREKYDVVARSDITHIGAGYTQNVIGFGWTNGVFLDLLQELPPASRSQLN